jgi:cytochrome c
MRQKVLRGLILATTALLAACGGGEKQETTGSEATNASAATPHRPAAFGQCLMCHSDVEDRSAIGPSLFGVVGRKAGSLPGYAYSPAMKAAGWTWDQAEIDHFITDPHTMVPGTKMSFAGLKNPQQRAEITGYLATLH